MQRLFSMFPAGPAGLGLVLLRLSAMVTLLLGVQHVYIESPLITWAIAVISFCLLVGLATPVCAAACCLAEFYILVMTSGTAPICVSVSAFVALAVTMLGPGAYSVDARLYGRRLVVIEAKARPDEEH